MSTQISSVHQELYEIFQRVFSLLDEPQFEPFSFHSKDKLGSRQIDKTFEESVIRSRHPNINEIVLRIQQCLAEHIKSEKQNIQKYEEQLQCLQAKMRKHTKNQIESRLLIETLEEENNQLRKDILSLKDELIDRQRVLEGTQLKMKTQIKTLQSQISSLKRLDNLISDKNFGFEVQQQNSKASNKQLRKKSAISQIKNRLSFCDVNDLQFDTLTPNTINDINRTVEYEDKIVEKKGKKRLQNTASKRSSYSSLSRKSIVSKEPQMKECIKRSNGEVKKKKNLKIKEVEVVGLKGQKRPQSRSGSKLKVKK